MQCNILFYVYILLYTIITTYMWLILLIKFDRSNIDNNILCKKGRKWAILVSV